MLAALAHDPVPVLLVRAGFALLFASAAWHKLGDRAAFQGVLAGYRVLPASLLTAATLAVAALEVGVALAWLGTLGGVIGGAGTSGLLASDWTIAPLASDWTVAPLARHVTIALLARHVTIALLARHLTIALLARHLTIALLARHLTIALLAIYSAAIAVNLARGRRAIDCGCGVGGTSQPISEWLLVRNLLLAIAAVGAAAPTAPRPLTWVDVLTLAGGLAVAALLWAAAHGLAAATERVRSLGAAR